MAQGSGKQARHAVYAELTISSRIFEIRLGSPAHRVTRRAGVRRHRIANANDRRYCRRSDSNSTSVRLVPRRRLKKATSSSKVVVRW